MSTEGYAQFLKNIGHQVVQKDDHYWFNTHPHIYISFPFNKPISKRKVDVLSILKRRDFALRFSCPLKEGRQSFRISVVNKAYDLSSLDSGSRRNTRRGLENCSVRKLNKEEILKDALQLNEETLVRQGRTLTNRNNDYWNAYYHEAVNAEGSTIWGAFVGDTLAAFLISFRMNRSENIVISRSRTSLLKHRPNNALLYQFIYDGIRSDEIDEISFGLESIQSDMDSLDRFKMGMGFQKIPVGQYVKFHPFIGTFLRKWNLPVILGVLHPLAAKKEKVAKLYGLLSWYSDQLKSEVK